MYTVVFKAFHHIYVFVLQTELKQNKKLNTRSCDCLLHKTTTGSSQMINQEQKSLQLTLELISKNETFLRLVLVVRQPFLVRICGSEQSKDSIRWMTLQETSPSAVHINIWHRKQSSAFLRWDLNINSNFSVSRSSFVRGAEKTQPQWETVSRHNTEQNPLF